MKFKSKNIYYETKIKLSLFPNAFVSSKTLIPDWYKNANRFKNNQMMNYEHGGINSTFKLCTPFLESMMLGYMITLPTDILVEQKDGSSLITWNPLPYNPVEIRSYDAHDGVPVPAGHDLTNFVWKIPVAFKVPRGYSLLFTHPFNRFDLPFTTLNAVIDGGYAVPVNGNVPFYLKNDFAGIIEKGTPIAQIVPFKIDNWKSKYLDGLAEEADDNNYLGSTKIFGWYKKNWWHKKYFE